MKIPAQIIRPTNKPPADPPRIGILAGWGRYPIVVAEALEKLGYEVYCLGARHHADASALARVCHDFRWVGIARLGTAVRYFRRHKVRHAIMLGKYHKRLLYQPWVWFRHTPDWTAARVFFPHFIGTSRDRKDDSLLGAIVDCLAGHGIMVKPATDFVPELLVKDGLLTRRGPTHA